MKQYYIYIMSSISGVLYIGMTNNLQKRIYEHKNEIIDGFTKKYKCKKLVYYEIGNDIHEIIKREKQLKSWSRNKKMSLIKTLNDKFVDLSINL